MESPARKHARDTASPLRTLSPHHINQQTMKSSKPERDRHSVDVQSKVAFLNRLASPGSPAPLQPSSTTHAALQRAILGREEAEETLRATTKELNEARQRERRVSERLESLLEELHTYKERQSQERALFEKEIRRARKEAFRAGSNLVKAQEELKSSRGEIKSLKDDVRIEREAKEKAKQDAFERAYALAGLTEENEVLKDQIRAFQTDNQSGILEAEAEMMRGETPRSRAQRSSINLMPGSSASRGKKRGLPDSRDQMSPVRKKSAQHQPDFRSSMKSPTKLTPSRDLVPFEQEGEEEPLKLMDNEREIIMELEEDLRWEKLMRRRAEDMIDFLKLECQFKRCSCRIAERQGIKYVHDLDWEKISPAEDQEKTTVTKIPSPLPDRKPSPHLQITEESPPSESADLDKLEADPASDDAPPEPDVVFCPDTGTFKAILSPARKAEPIPPERSNSRPAVNRTEPPPKPRWSLHDDPVPAPSSVVPKKRNEEPPLVAALEASDHQPQSPRPTIQELPATTNPRKRYVTPLSLEQRQRQHQNNTTAEVETITTTKTVPLNAERASTDLSAKLPGTPISREEALAQIRARRGRTQSALKRSASANDASHRPRVVSGTSTPSNVVRSVSRAEGMTISRAKPGRRGLSTASHGY
ncbi:hypothetical protein MGYG_07024 [Nannizzia gypsea CBS 118893]|uniref:Uncharacterized protein n=1 Tax=Arthroderma gypseum (strain ATCC MYA-4604 / CBS 118893) TaxID=535722 RepID=E4V1V4_ARTGP|nr:hypothetical protein MGYG_07024 [Nannizzia gypsea CBS 118893]EFR04019.1 hypothetical protein MGYG_07024 [Nannizzia gypsea CBS 118893]